MVAIMIIIIASVVDAFYVAAAIVATDVTMELEWVLDVFFFFLFVDSTHLISF